MRSLGEEADTQPGPRRAWLKVMFKRGSESTLSFVLTSLLLKTIDCNGCETLHRRLGCSEACRALDDSCPVRELDDADRGFPPGEPGVCPHARDAVGDS